MNREQDPPGPNRRAPMSPALPALAGWHGWHSRCVDRGARQPALLPGCSSRSRTQCGGMASVVVSMSSRVVLDGLERYLLAIIGRQRQQQEVIGAFSAALRPGPFT